MFVPRAAWLAEALHQGRMPTWNAEVGCGFDQYLTLQTAACYPPMWLYGVLPLPIAMAVLLGGHLLLGAAGMFCWVRKLGGSICGAVLAGAAFAFGAVGESQWPIILYTLVWTPWLLLLVDGPARMSGRRWVALAAVVALHVLPGYPQLVAYVGILVAAYVLVRAICERAPLATRLAALFRPASAALLGVAIAGVQLIPSFAYMHGECWRSGTLTPDEVHYTEPLPLPGLAQQWARMLPKAVENSSKDRVLSNRFSFGYLGVFMPICVAAALAGRRSWRVGFFAAAAVAGLYLSLGFSPTPVPLYEWFAKLPLIGSFRTPDRLLVWYLIAACVLMGLGADVLFESCGRAGRAWLLLAAGLGLIALRVGLWRKLGAEPANLAVWLLGAALTIGATALQLRRREVAVPEWLQPAAVGILLIDLWLACGYMCPVRPFPTEQFDRLATKDGPILSRDELRAISAAAGPERMYVAEPYRPVMRTGYLPAFRTLPFYESLMPTRHYHLCDAVAPGGAEGVRHFGLWNLPAVPHLQLFDLCSVRLFATRTPIADSEAHGWQPVTISGVGSGVHVYQNQRAVPRASLQTSYQLADDPTALERFASAGVAATQPVVLLDRAPEPAPPASGSTAANSPGEVRWLLDSAQELRLETQADFPALLLVTDSWSPGWSATVDGQPAAVLRANYLHRAVSLPAGRHVIEFRYRVPNFAGGAACSLAACVVAMVVWFCSRGSPAVPTGVESRE